MATLLLVSSAFLHALWNAMVKSCEDQRTGLMGMLVAAAIAALAALPFFDTTLPTGFYGPLWTLAAGLGEAGYMISLARALEKTPLGLAYIIMRGGAMLGVWFISSLFLGERVTGPALLGVIVVFLGLVVSQSGVKKAPLLKASWAYLCAAFIAVYHLCYGRALEHGMPPAALFAMALWVSIPIFILTSGGAAQKKLGTLLAQRPVFISVGGILCAASFIIFLIGLRHAGAGYGITLRNTSVVFAQVFAFFLGERMSRRQWLGAVLVVVGAALLNGLDTSWRLL